jgi:hypothetical protein
MLLLLLLTMMMMFMMMFMADNPNDPIEKQRLRFFAFFIYKAWLLRQCDETVAVVAEEDEDKTR